MTELDKEKEEALIRQATRGDGEAFTRLYDMYMERIYRYVSYRVSIVADVEDLTQEVFLRAWNSIRGYQPRNPFLAWLFTIAHNRVIDYYRKKGRQLETTLDDLPLSTGGAEDPEMEEMVDRDTVRRLIAHLSGDEQQVLMLRFVEGLDYSDVASALGKSQGAVRVIQLRALRRLRQLLQAGKKRK